jgi:hypothetical protein
MALSDKNWVETTIANHESYMMTDAETITHKDFLKSIRSTILNQKIK